MSRAAIPAGGPVDPTPARAPARTAPGGPPGPRPGPGGEAGWVTLEGARRVVRPYLPAVVIVGLQLAVFPLPAGEWIRGLLVGVLVAMLAVGMGLIWRANRIVSFAQADLGLAPATLAALVVVSSGWPWIVGLAVALITGLVVGGVVEAAVIRRFATAPRMVLTVATLGLGQLLAFAAAGVPRLWDDPPVAPRIEPAFELRWVVDPIIFNANHVLVAVVGPAVLGLVAIALSRTDAGLAVRAAAERADRAAMLGVPVRNLNTLVWATAGALAALALYLRAGILGLPVGTAQSFLVLLRALGALVLGSMGHLGAVAAAGVALGVLDLAVTWNTSSPLVAEPVLAAVIIAGILARRLWQGPLRRADLHDVASWRDVEEHRPLPPEVARWPAVRALRWIAVAVGAAALAALPHVVATDTALRASAMLIFGVIGLSLVVLTGWAGQISLGHMAFVAVGAVAGARLSNGWGWDLTLVLPAAGTVTAVVAAAVGYPALRIRGLWAAVTTLAFAVAANAWLLNRRFFDWLPEGRIARSPILGRISYDSPTRLYYLTLAVLVVCWVALAGIRSWRPGRVIIAVRDNELAAAAAGIGVVRTRLSAFAISGFFAGVAGALFVHHQQAYDPSSFTPAESIAVLTMVVVGGAGSLLGGVVGALWIRGVQWLIGGPWQLFATGAGVLAVLMVLPGGIVGAWVRARDAAVAAYARRTGRTVPGEQPDPDRSDGDRRDLPPVPGPPAGTVHR